MKQNEKLVEVKGMNGNVISTFIAMKTAYLSGKITNAPELNKPKFAAAETLLRVHGFKVINPHTICDDIPKGSMWEAYMKRCVEHLPKADVVFLLDDWKDSTGARLESVIAHQLGIKVYELEEYKFDATN